MNALIQKDLEDRLMSATQHSQRVDKIYAESYTTEVALWEIFGLYDHMAQLVPTLPEEGIHVDLGCALANLACRIKQANPHAIVAGVDRNTFLLGGAVAHAKEQGVPTKAFHREMRLIDTSKLIRTRYLGAAAYKAMETEESDCIGLEIKSRALMPHLEEDDDQFLQIDPALRLVVDDIRSLELLQMLLNGREIDSVSFSLPGGSSRYAYEAPNITPFAGVKVHRQAEAVRVNKGILESIYAAIKFTTSRLKQGGHLIIGNRFPHQRALEYATRHGLSLPVLMGEQTYRAFEIDPDRFRLTRMQLSDSLTIPKLPKNLPSITSWGLPGDQGEKTRDVEQADQLTKDIAIGMFQFRKET